MNPITLRYVKYQFNKHRGVVYQSLENGISQTGTKKQELLSDTFKRWADRDSKRGKAIAYAYRAIQKRLETGKSLSDALAPFIPVEEMLTIQAGERGVVNSGEKPKLALAIESARRQKDAGDEMRKAINGAMIEPMSQVVIFILMSLIYGVFVWPEMLHSFPVEYWPGWTVPFIQMQVWMANNWLFSIGIVAIIALYYWSLPNWSGKVRMIFDEFPPYSIYRDRMASALLGTLGGLLHGGLTLEESLRRIQARSTPYLKWHIRRMIRGIPSSGKDPMKALNTGLFSKHILDQIEDAASSREFDETLTHIGRAALNSVIDVVKRAVIAASVSILAFVGMLVLYQTAVQIFGVQDAADNFMAASSNNTKEVK